MASTPWHKIVVLEPDISVSASLLIFPNGPFVNTDSTYYILGQSWTAAQLHPLQISNYFWYYSTLLISRS